MFHHCMYLSAHHPPHYISTIKEETFRGRVRSGDRDTILTDSTNWTHSPLISPENHLTSFKSSNIYYIPSITFNRWPAYHHGTTTHLLPILGSRPKTS